jgi:AcrR family transcriptional regulator
VTIVDHDPTSQRAPWAKQRILDVASELFYQEGIRLVGVDRLISESQVTKATFYKHYRAKDNLALAYVAGRHERDKESVEGLIRDSASPRDALEKIVGRIISALQRPDFRGCLYLNAAAEYPDPAHPIRQLVSTHRDWYSTTIQELLTATGHPLPGEGSDDFILARDGAMSGGYAGDPIAAAGALQRAAARILAEARA